MNSAVSLNVKVNRVNYPQPGADGNWYILSTNHGTAKGEIGWRPQAGERLLLEGVWSEYQGRREFKFKTATVDVPVSEQDRLHYVCERTTGIGPAMERRIWDKYGEGWRKVEPKSIAGMNLKIFNDFQETVAEIDREIDQHNAIAFLLGKECTMNLATAAWEKWQRGTIGVVSSDCYRLAEIKNYGFQDIDKRIRQAFGIADNDPRRVDAAILYAMGTLTSSGSTVVEWPELGAEVLKICGGSVSPALVEQCCARLIEEKFLRHFDGKIHLVAVADDWNNEKAIWEFVSA